MRVFVWIYIHQVGFLRDNWYFHLLSSCWLLKFEYLLLNHQIFLLFILCGINSNTSVIFCVSGGDTIIPFIHPFIFVNSNQIHSCFFLFNIRRDSVSFILIALFVVFFSSESIFSTFCRNFLRIFYLSLLDLGAFYCFIVV